MNKEQQSTPLPPETAQLGGAIMPGPVKENTGAVEATPVADMNFMEALEEAIKGKKIFKKDWEDKNFYGVFDGNTLKIHNSDNKLHNWIITAEDVTGEDWIVI